VTHLCDQDPLALLELALQFRALASNPQLTREHQTTGQRDAENHRAQPSEHEEFAHLGRIELFWIVFSHSREYLSHAPGRVIASISASRSCLPLMRPPNIE